MIRKIITIDATKCNGCGLCVDACHEGAIVMQNGKAVLLRDDYCDGLGDCLPVCPTDALSFEEREALPYDEAAVQENIKQKNAQNPLTPLPCGCPGSNTRTLKPLVEQTTLPLINKEKTPSFLQQWPIQIALVPVNAPYFANANILVAADCTAFAYGNFHAEFMQGKITIIGCPKLDAETYVNKLADIIQHNSIQSVSVVRMSVPCCGGIENAVMEAIKKSNKIFPWQVITINPEGKIVAKKP